MTAWQITNKTLNEKRLFLFESGQWHDCEFIVGMESNQQVFQAHRLILTMASPVFEAMLFGEMAEREPIKVVDTSPDTFRSLMLYVYSDQIDLQSFDQACEICYAAKKYMLPHLVESCMKFIRKNLESHNVCQAYEFAKLFDEPSLMEKCMKRITEKTGEVLGTCAIEDVQHATLMTIVEQGYLNIRSELDIFNALVRWSRKECERRPLEVSPLNQRMVLGDALYRVRYLTMSSTMFAEGPAVSGLLTPEESLAIVLNILTPGKWPMPDHLDSCTALRNPSRHPGRTAPADRLAHAVPGPRRADAGHYGGVAGGRHVHRLAGVAGAVLHARHHSHQVRMDWLRGAAAHARHRRRQPEADAQVLHVARQPQPAGGDPVERNGADAAGPEVQDRVAAPQARLAPNGGQQEPGAGQQRHIPPH